MCEDGPLAVWLSDHEKDLLFYLCDGQPWKIVAYHMGVVDSTVRASASRLARALGVSGSRGLFKWAMQNPNAWRKGSVGAIIRQHPPGCSCDVPYCRTMRLAKAA